MKLNLIDNTWKQKAFITLLDYGGGGALSMNLTIFMHVHIYYAYCVYVV